MEFYGCQPVHNPSIPIIYHIKGGVFPGKQIFVQGFVPHGADRFQIDLKCSHRACEEDRVFHFNPRWVTDHAIVLNTCEHDSWGEEERHDQCIQQGAPFEIQIFVEENSFKVVYNGSHVCEYMHRAPIHTIDQLGIEGDVEVSMVRFGPGCVRSPSTPYVGMIPGGPAHDRLIIIDGQAYGDRFSVNLRPDPHSEDDGTNCFHLNPRFAESEVVRNTCHDGTWGEEEKHGDFPFQMGAPFVISLLLHHDSIKVAVNGQYHSEYQHRMPMSMCTFLSILGDVNVNSIRFE